MILETPIFLDIEKSLQLVVSHFNQNLKETNNITEINFDASISRAFMQLYLESIPLCDILVHCTHKISIRNFELLGEDMINLLEILVKNNPVSRYQSNDLDKEDLTF